jgi:hypothetical protein
VPRNHGGSDDQSQSKAAAGDQTCLKISSEQVCKSQIRWHKEKKASGFEGLADGRFIRLASESIRRSR